MNFVHKIKSEWKRAGPAKNVVSKNIHYLLVYIHAVHSFYQVRELNFSRIAKNIIFLSVPK